ncbi:hypothetical protein Tco_0702838 [Tanacetum coccineum]|uniref:Uncharacterized protein n=1 Tax=Tanacetum coccineum TaxID=301880 RepID=A0ABQ4XYH5_9ASTR
MRALRKLAAGPYSLEKRLARLEAEAKKAKENGFVDDPMFFYDKVYTNLRKYGNEFGVSSQHSKDLCKRKKQTIAIKEHLNTILNNNNRKDIRSLLRSIQDGIQIVTHFYNETRDVPYNYMGRRFIPELKRARLFAIVLNVCYPNKIEEKIWKEFEEIDKENLCFLLLDAFACEHEVDLLMRNGVERMSIDADHPIVSADGNFSVKAFNEACTKAMSGKYFKCLQSIYETVETFPLLHRRLWRYRSVQSSSVMQVGFAFLITSIHSPLVGLDIFHWIHMIVELGLDSWSLISRRLQQPEVDRFDLDELGVGKLKLD